jgi:hypothetical protein
MGEKCSANVKFILAIALLVFTPNCTVAHFDQTNVDLSSTKTPIHTNEVEAIY